MSYGYRDKCVLSVLTSRLVLLFAISLIGACAAKSSTKQSAGTQEKASSTPQTKIAEAEKQIPSAPSKPCEEARTLKGPLPNLHQFRQPLMEIPGGKQAVSVAAGEARSCALDCAGRVFCWHQVDEMNLEDAEFEMAAPEQKLTDWKFRGMALGSHLCGIAEDGTVICYGNNGSGQLGTGSTDPVKGPVRVKGVSGATDLVLNSNNSCATTAEGLYCWGENWRNSLGLGPQGNQAIPKKLPSIIQVDVGHTHSCGINGKGEVQCWGRSVFHVLGCEHETPGCGTEAHGPVGTPIPGLVGVQSVKVGGDHVCALTAPKTLNSRKAKVGEGDVLCWGNNDSGQSGGSVRGKPWIPHKVDGLPPVKKISAGYQHTCALTRTGEVYCWGSNLFGQSGPMTKTEYRAPIAIEGIPEVREVSAGDTQTCVLTVHGQVLCWGIAPDPRD